MTEITIFTFCLSRLTSYATREVVVALILLDDIIRDGATRAT